MASDGDDRALGSEPLSGENVWMRFAEARRDVVSERLRLSKGGRFEQPIGYREPSDQVRDRDGSRRLDLELRMFRDRTLDRGLDRGREFGQ